MDRFDIEPVWRELQSRGGAIARPAILLRARAQIRAHWIENHVPEHIRKVGFPIDKKRFESSLKQVATAAVGSVEPVCVPAVEPVHPYREVRLRSLYDEVIVVRHQHPRGERPTEPLHRDAEENEELLAVADGAKDRSTLIAAGSNVVQRISEFES
jgi:hypothetical protein